MSEQRTELEALAAALYREIGDTNADWLNGKRGAQLIAEKIDALIKQRIAECAAAQQ